MPWLISNECTGVSPDIPVDRHVGMTPFVSMMDVTIYTYITSCLFSKVTLLV